MFICKQMFLSWWFRSVYKLPYTCLSNVIVLVRRHAETNVPDNHLYSTNRVRSVIATNSIHFEVVVQTPDFIESVSVFSAYEEYQIS